MWKLKNIRIGQSAAKQPEKVEGSTTISRRE